MHKSILPRLAAVVLVLLVVGGGIGVAQTTTVQWVERFEEGPDGAPVTGWNETWYSGTSSTDNINYDNATVYEGNFSGVVTRQDGGGISKELPVYQPDNITFALNRGDEGFNVAMDDVFRLSDDNINTTLQANTWYVFKIRNIDYTNRVYDLTVETTSGSVYYSESDRPFYYDTGTTAKFFTVLAGGLDRFWVDSIRVGGVDVSTPTPVPPQESENLTFDVRNFMEPNSTYPYTVYHYNNSTGETTDVTQSATLSIENVTLNGTQVLTQPAVGSLSTINNSAVNATVNVTAEYSGLAQTKEIVVAAPTVENLELLPNFTIRAWAVFSDSTMFALIIASLLSVASSRFVNAFAGLATSQVVVVIAWFAGYIGIGVAMLSVFTAIFLGLNLAENTVQLRGGR